LGVVVFISAAFFFMEHQRYEEQHDQQREAKKSDARNWHYNSRGSVRHWGEQVDCQELDQTPSFQWVEEDA
jgi:hypothetical protein